MPFEYSCFISYRREKQRNNFISSFCEHLNTKAKDATNIDKIFFDTNEIKNGVPFPNKIYDSIRRSCVFLVFNTQHYLNADDYWCAKELFYALKVEEKRHYQLVKMGHENFNSILIFLVNGGIIDLPNSIKDRNSDSLKEFEYFGRFLKNKESKKLLDKIGDRIYEIQKAYLKFPALEFSEFETEIQIPTDHEIKEWILEQKAHLRQFEAQHIPMLVKK